MVHDDCSAARWSLREAARRPDVVELHGAAVGLCDDDCSHRFQDEPAESGHEVCHRVRLWQHGASVKWHRFH